MKTLFPLILASLLLTFAVSAQNGAAAQTKATAPGAEKRTVFRATKDQIIDVQNKLKQANLYSGDTTGKMDDATKTAIKNFQKDNGLKASGSLNRATLEKFGVELTESQKLIPVNPDSFASAKPDKADSDGNTPKRPAPFRANKEQIMAAQNILREAKVLTGGEEGKLDDDTREGLKKYQQAKGLKITGTLNPATLEKMGIVLTDAQKANVAAQAAYEAAKGQRN